MTIWTISSNLLHRTIGTVRGFSSWILLPTLIISLFIILFGGDFKDTVHRVYYMNMDQGKLGQGLIQQLSTQANYRLFPVSHPDHIRVKTATRKANEAFIIPEDFTSNILLGNRAYAEVVYSNVESTNFALKVLLDSMVEEVVLAAQPFRANKDSLIDEDAVADRILAQKNEQLVVMSESDKKLWSTPNVNSIAEVNRVMLIFIMGIISYVIVLVVHDRKQHILSRMFTAPVKSHHIVLANSLGAFIVGTLQIATMLFTTRVLFQYDYGGMPVIQQFVVLIMFLLASLGIASLVGALSKESNQIGLVHLLVVLPTSMLGGCFWSISDMPPLLQKISNLVPQSWALKALNKVEDGAGWMDLSTNLSILAAFAVVLLLFGSYLFVPKEAD
ncbi:Linearmycin resistance permease protein LnrN [Paenibacillus plantiphilus]|uniref:Linearmycin resistance permease protein LnrN n=1 Tax=Paenibacillus plantiphilus TaxID=2905650 RepID=A0ABN8GAY5_9BACL|nr:ABC transporter permease [Paenibacillus plantiphilus]CAH1200602.1 Linearmycin resistance permease protein LnrN [Paenibacillus plantiphilus]